MDLAKCGQNLYHPPTAAGFPKVQNWINNITIIHRSQMAQMLIQQSGPYKGKLNPWITAQKHDCHDLDTAADYIFKLLYQNNPIPINQQSLLQKVSGESISGNSTNENIIRKFTEVLITLPEFHLA